jgi:hypothetical protein
MTFKHTLLFGAILFVAGITVLHVFVNEGDLPFGSWATDRHARLRIGFLPVT